MALQRLDMRGERPPREAPVMVPVIGVVEHHTNRR